MRFSRKNWAKFFDGSGKTTTIRLKPVPVGHKNVWSGNYHSSELVGELDLVSVDKVKFSMLSTSDAVNDGFSSIEELKEELKRIYSNEVKDDTDVYIHRIKNPVNKIKNVKNEDYEFEIVGECKGCGACCYLQTYAGPYNFKISKKFKEYLTMFGISKEIYDCYYLYPDLKPGTIIYHRNIKCPNLDESNLCKIYETRPKMCREFPTTKDFNFLKCENIKCGFSLREKPKSTSLNEFL